MQNAGRVQSAVHASPQRLPPKERKARQPARQKRGGRKGDDKDEMQKMKKKLFKLEAS